MESPKHQIGNGQERQQENEAIEKHARDGLTIRSNCLLRLRYSPTGVSPSTLQAYMLTFNVENEAASATQRTIVRVARYFAALDIASPDVFRNSVDPL
jgi:hypothetical protein